MTRLNPEICSPLGESLPCRAGNDTVDEQKQDGSHDCADPRADIEEFVDGISEPECLRDESTDERACDANERRDDDAAGIVTRQQRLRDDPGQKPQDDPAEDAHTSSPFHSLPRNGPSDSRPANFETGRAASYEASRLRVCVKASMKGGMSLSRISSGLCSAVNLPAARAALSASGRRESFAASQPTAKKGSPRLDALLAAPRTRLVRLLALLPPSWRSLSPPSLV